MNPRWFFETFLLPYHPRYFVRFIRRNRQGLLLMALIAIGLGIYGYRPMRASLLGNPGPSGSRHSDYKILDPTDVDLTVFRGYPSRAVDASGRFVPFTRQTKKGKGFDIIVWDRQRDAAVLSLHTADNIYEPDAEPAPVFFREAQNELVVSIQADRSIGRWDWLDRTTLLRFDAETGGLLEAIPVHGCILFHDVSPSGNLLVGEACAWFNSEYTIGGPLHSYELARPFRPIMFDFRTHEKTAEPVFIRQPTFASETTLIGFMKIGVVAYDREQRKILEAPFHDWQDLLDKDPGFASWIERDPWSRVVALPFSDQSMNTSLLTIPRRSEESESEGEEWPLEQTRIQYFSFGQALRHGDLCSDYYLWNSYWDLKDRDRAQRGKLHSYLSRSDEDWRHYRVGPPHSPEIDYRFVDSKTIAIAFRPGAAAANYELQGGIFLDIEDILVQEPDYR